MFHRESKENISSGIFKMLLLLTITIVIIAIGLKTFLNQQLRWEINVVIVIVGFLMGIAWVSGARLLIASYRMDQFVNIVKQIEGYPDLECRFWNTYACSMLTAALSYDADFMKGYHRFKKLFPPK